MELNETPQETNGAFGELRQEMLSQLISSIPPAQRRAIIQLTKKIAAIDGRVRVLEENMNISSEK